MRDQLVGQPGRGRDSNGSDSAAGKKPSVMSVITKVPARAEAVNRPALSPATLRQTPNTNISADSDPGIRPLRCAVDRRGSVRRRATDWRPARMRRISGQAVAAHAADPCGAPPSRFNSVDSDGHTTPGHRCQRSGTRSRSFALSPVLLLTTGRIDPYVTYKLANVFIANDGGTISFLLIRLQENLAGNV